MKQPIVFLFTILLSFALQAQTKPPTEPEPTLEETKEFLLYILNSAEWDYVKETSGNCYGVCSMVYPSRDGKKWLLNNETLSYFNSGVVDIVINFRDYRSVSVDGSNIKILGAENLLTITQPITKEWTTPMQQRPTIFLRINSPEENVEERFLKALQHYLKLAGIKQKTSKF